MGIDIPDPAADIALVSSENLPNVLASTSHLLAQLTQAIGVERGVLPSDTQIAHVWSQLPRQLGRIPPALRDENLVRMCVSAAAGLFDAAANYIWNASILHLRNKIRNFGLNVVPQVVRRSFDEKILIELKDAELLELCLQLNLISEDGYFILDQCRDIRNNFSAAHPTLGPFDEDELVTFISRCGKHALGNERNPRGVDVASFVNAVKGDRFIETQLDSWVDNLRHTFEAQRELLFRTLHGIYCDPQSGEEARLNALGVCTAFKGNLAPRVRSNLVFQHQEYLAKGDTARHKASLQLFQKLGLLDLINDAEFASLIASRCKRLISVHRDLNNFYNEPPFAADLEEVVRQRAVPESIQQEFVEAVVTCAVGNAYGVSWAAETYYHRMIRAFSPRQISTMLDLPDSNTIVGNRVKTYADCRTRYKRIVAMLDLNSIPTSARKQYGKWT